MRQRIILLLIIAVLLIAGYVAWDRSFREEITQQDIELVKKHRTGQKKASLPVTRPLVLWRITGMTRPSPGRRCSINN